MDILGHDHHWPLSHQAGRHRQERLVDLAMQHGRRRRLGRRCSEKSRQCLLVSRVVKAQAAGEFTCLGADLISTVLRLQSDGAPQRLDDWLERAVPGRRRAEQRDNASHGIHLAEEGAQQSRFSDSWFSGQQHDLTVLAAGEVPASTQGSELGIAPDCRRSSGEPQPGQGIAEAGLADHMGGGDRHRQSYPCGVGGFGDESIAKQPQRRFPRYDTVRSCQCLQTGGDVRRGSYRGKVLDRGARSLIRSDVADEHPAGFHRDPHSDGHIGLQSGDRGGDFQPTRDRRLCIPPAGQRPAKICENAVADDASDRTALATHGLVYNVAIQRQKVCVGFRIHAEDVAGRIHHVAEQDAQVASFHEVDCSVTLMSVRLPRTYPIAKSFLTPAGRFNSPSV